MAFLKIPMGNAGGGGNNYLPVVKYDARAGRMFRVDRLDGVSTQVDITREFKAIIDFENVEVGWLRFAPGSAPDMQLVRNGEMLPDRPSEEHRRGVRIVLKLAKSVGGDIRELAGTSGCFMSGISMIADMYEAGVASNPGKLPVCALIDTRPVESGNGSKKSTNYEPVFQIVGWVDRPDDMKVPNLRGNTMPKPAAPSATPPSTGSTPVAPPAAAAPAATVTTGEDDFG